LHSYSSNSDEIRRKDNMEKKNLALILGIVVISTFLLYWSVNAQLNSGKAAEKAPEQLSAGPEEGGVIKNIEEHTDESFKRANEAQTEDPCATPEGYTDESWRQHMSHHPDVYKDCV
jgi:hypothetical protein